MHHFGHMGKAAHPTKDGRKQRPKCHHRQRHASYDTQGNHGGLSAFGWGILCTPGLFGNGTQRHRLALHQQLIGRRTGSRHQQPQQEVNKYNRPKRWN